MLRLWSPALGLPRRFEAAHPEEALGQELPLRNALTDPTLCCAHRRPLPFDPQAIVVKSDHQRIAGLEAKQRAKLGRDHDSPFPPNRVLTCRICQWSPMASSTSKDVIHDYLYQLPDKRQFFRCDEEGMQKIAAPTSHPLRCRRGERSDLGAYARLKAAASPARAVGRPGVRC